jgi:hypothetical protein
MPPPSQLAIATSSVNRLLKEEASYHKELEQEEANIETLKKKIDSGASDNDENAPYILKQQVGLQDIIMHQNSQLTISSKPPSKRQRPFLDPYEKRLPPLSRS